MRSTWRAGTGGRIAQVLDFSAGGLPLPAASRPGQAFWGEVVFHTGAAGLRGVIRTQAPAAAQPLPGVGVAAALDGVGEALARVPWLEEWPMILRGVRFARVGVGGGWAVADGGMLLSVAEAPSVVPFVAVAGGMAADVFGLGWAGAASAGDRAGGPAASPRRGRSHPGPAGGMSGSAAAAQAWGDTLAACTVGVERAGVPSLPGGLERRGRAVI